MGYCRFGDGNHCLLQWAADSVFPGEDRKEAVSIALELTNSLNIVKCEKYVARKGWRGKSNSKDKRHS